MSRYLITSALPYINGIKHLGNLAGSLLPADVYARFLRQEGEEVLFICATDEHGTPAELSARKKDQEVAEYCQEMHHIQADIYEQFGLSFDYFGRTSARPNHEQTQLIYQQLERNGYIEERCIQQIYSPEDGRFLPDRYVEGTCPKCGYEAARGDQCESCTSVLEPTDLLEPRSALSGSQSLEVRKTQHLFLRLDQLSDEVKNWVQTHKNWPKLTHSIAMKWIDEGLQPRGITRDLNWGIPVPREGFSDKVFYVWFDAPIGYIGATQEWAEASDEARDWKDWWLEAEDVIYTQFMAKDNVPFHTVFFPAMLLGTKEPWTMADQIKSFNWLNYYEGKFSTSQQRGVFMDQALEELPADTWRYFLIAQSPESDDSNFTWETFARVVNKDLVGTYGNFVNRVLKLTASKFGNAVPEGGEVGEAERRLQADCEQLLHNYQTALRKLELRKAVQALRELWTQGNLYLDAQAPWSLIHDHREQAGMVMRTAINLIRTFTIAATPLLPHTVEKVYEALNIPGNEQFVPLAKAMDLNYLSAGHSFTVPELLFQRLTPEELERLKEKYGGK